MPKSQTTVEVKLMQRQIECDVNAMLLYVFYMLKLNDDLVLEDSFEKNFISRCFYCGCDKEQSGMAISYFVISKISFAIFVHHIMRYYKHDPDYKNLNYMEQLFVDIFNALQNGLQEKNGKQEKVLIYDEKEVKFVKPQRYLKDNDDLRKFIRPFIKLSDKKISDLYKQHDDLLLLYNTIKNKLPVNTDLSFFYTLYDDIEPVDIPKIIKQKFVFCTRTYRNRYKNCVTKEYIEDQINTITNKTYIDLNDELFKKFYHFAGINLQ